MYQQVIEDKKFFSILTNEISRIKGVKLAKRRNVGVRKAVSGQMSFKKAGRDVDYLEDLLGELEKKKLLAIMHMTPDKIAKAGPATLSKLIKNVDAMTEEIRLRLRKLDAENEKSVNKGSNLTKSERERIEKFLNR